MITIGICDDEPDMRRTLRRVVERKLQLLGEDYRILEYDSGEALLSQPGPDAPDILFLDIEMKELNGMDTARALRDKNPDTIIIFVTAYPDYVFQGYEVRAFHYILKPYVDRKIEEVLESAVLELDAHKEQFFTIEQKSGVSRIAMQKIIALCSDRRKVLLVTENGEQEFYGQLGEIEGTLPGYFVRIHNRYIVNLNFVTALEKESCICAQRHYPVSRAFRRGLEVAFARSLL